MFSANFNPVPWKMGIWLGIDFLHEERKVLNSGLAWNDPYWWLNVKLHITWQKIVSACIPNQMHIICTYQNQLRLQIKSINIFIFNWLSSKIIVSAWISLHADSHISVNLPFTVAFRNPVWCPVRANRGGAVNPWSRTHRASWGMFVMSRTLQWSRQRREKTCCSRC